MDSDRFFYYERVAEEAKIPPDKLDILRRIIRKDFPKNKMLYELHLLRICMSIRDGDVDLDKAIRSGPQEKK